jgi:integrase
MGRYPLRAAIDKYIEVRKLQVGESTWKNERRYLRNMADHFEPTDRPKRLGATNPERMGPKEIRAIIEWMQDPRAHRDNKPLDPDTQVRYLEKLEGVLAMSGNRIIEQMRKEGYQFPRRVAKKPIRALTMPDLEAIQESAKKIGSATGEPEGWRRAKAELLMSAYVATGTRPSELREAYMVDLDTRNWRLYVRFPKGGAKWAENRKPMITPPYRQAFLNYLKAREELLRYYGRKEATHLIPNLRSGDNPYSSNHFRVLKKEVQEVSGIDFKLKDFRPTFASLTVEMDPNSLVDVSTTLGHSNLLTTQRYYAQICAESAGSRINKLWERATKKPAPTVASGEVEELLKILGVTSIEELKSIVSENSISAKKGVIDPKERLPGYF